VDEHERLAFTHGLVVELTTADGHKPPLERRPGFFRAFRDTLAFWKRDEVEKFAHRLVERDGLFDIHKMTGVIEDDPPGSWNTGFDRTRVGVDIGNIVLGRDDQCRHVDLAQPGERGFFG